MIDTNVIIDFLIAREPFYNSALQVIKKCASGEVNGYIAFHSLIYGIFLEKFQKRQDVSG